jgi:hypothetical protein
MSLRQPCHLMSHDARQLRALRTPARRPIECPTGLRRARPESPSGGVHDQLDEEHAARQAYGGARLSFRGGPPTRPSFFKAGGDGRWRRRWLLAGYGKGAEEFVRFAHPITRPIQPCADSSRRLQ